MKWKWAGSEGEFESEFLKDYYKTFDANQVNHLNSVLTILDILQK